MTDQPISADSTRSTLVVGAGIAGIKAALELAEAGVHVYLTDIRHHVGGTLSQLERQFPTNHCGMCRILPTITSGKSPQFCLRREVYHENITLLPGTVLKELGGEAGAFDAHMETLASGVNQDTCIACRRCLEVCPVEVPDEFNENLSTRKAIHVRNPQAVPNVYAIDFEACTRCGKCVEICPTDAVDLEAEAKQRKFRVGAVILTAGFEEFQASAMGQYGHRRWKNVITSIEFERLISEVNPEGGDLKRPFDGKKPGRIAFLQCVGSRDTERPYCSAACCMFALKESLLAKELCPDVDTHIFAMDIRAFGKGYHRYLDMARNAGVVIRRGRIPTVREIPGAGDLELSVANEKGGCELETFDMVVLSVGFMPPPTANALFEAAGLEPGPHGFCATRSLAPVDTERPGVFVAGPLSEPKDIPESVAQASAAAARAFCVLAPDPPARLDESEREIKKQETKEGEQPEEDPKAAVILCACGGEVGDALDLKALGDALEKHPDVVHVRTSNVLCAAGAPGDAIANAVQAGANRILIGACVPYRFAMLFRQAAVENGIDPALVETVNLKEGVAWVHEGPQAQGKAGDLMSMALERLLLETPSIQEDVPVDRTVLVAGGGVAGLTAALALADAGFPVELIERSGKLGGHLLEPVPSLEPGEPSALIGERIDKAEGHERISVRLESEWISLCGSAGNFVSRIRGPAGEEEIRHGAGIVAIGGKRIQPDEYLCGSHPRSLTHTEFARRIAKDEVNPAEVGSIAVILCAGLRSDPRPWCARTCCSEALGVAERVLDANPKAQVNVFHRDVMTYGFLEEGYKRLREKGALFFRFTPDVKPGVKAEGDRIAVEAVDPILDATVTLRPDYVVVSAGWGPPQGGDLAEVLGVDLDEDGFFAEADVKFRPVDFMKDGLYVAGLAHSPRNVSETVWTALAASGRVMALLSRGKMEGQISVVSEVDARRCSACEACVAACPYDARFLDEETGVVVVREAICQGCGACQTACPNDAAKLKGFKHRQVSAMIDAALGI